MKINKDTKISVLIKENKDSIDAIAAIAKPFEKLKNPLLRKLMAPRVTIAEAASIGKISVEAFAKALIPLGFEFEDANADVLTEENNQPEWLTNLDKKQIIDFDVREMLAENQDPLKAIMKRFKEVQTGEALCIINTFIPTPLISILEKNNVVTHTNKISDLEYHTYFYKSTDNIKTAIGKPKEGLQIFNISEEEFLKHKAQFSEEQIQEIDVRHLEMPGPMQTILGALETLPSDGLLFVHHKRVPIYLLEELESRNFAIHIWSVEDGYVKLMIEQSGG